MTKAFRMPTGDRATDAGLIRIAVLAVGGQGGGVLSGWIVALAEANGYLAQVTSVPGVAQRTGATVYYVEMIPDRGRVPVLALMPSPGDLDIVIAAEIMEAGRAVTRGFVTPGQTTLIASDHRVYAVSEKIVPGDGQADRIQVRDAADEASARFVCFDMERMAEDTGSHISACLFGALAGSGALPFDRHAFEETIRASGRGVESSLRAFGAAFDAAAANPAKTRTGAAPEEMRDPAPSDVTGPPRPLAAWHALCRRLDAMPTAVRPMARAGLQKVCDYQDVAYGREYLDLLERGVALDRKEGGESRDWAYGCAMAKYLAQAMCYDDTIRVADLKTRGSRFDRVREHARPRGEAILEITEYMHPRGQEVCGMLPTRIGRWVEARPKVEAWIDRRVSRGRRVRTNSLVPFLTLYALAGLRPFRRRLLRHAHELEHRDAWLAEAERCTARDYTLGVEILTCRRLVKGYSDTHARGLSKFDRVIGAVPLVERREDAADWIRRLREAALADEKGTSLDGAIATVKSFAAPVDA